MKTYYQPVMPCSDGINEWEDLPCGLWSHQAFLSFEEADEWLLEHGYNPAEFVTHEYHDDDIEDVIIIDALGNRIDC